MGASIGKSLNAHNRCAIKKICTLEPEVVLLTYKYNVVMSE